MPPDKKLLTEDRKEEDAEDVTMTPSPPQFVAGRLVIVLMVAVLLVEVVIVPSVTSILVRLGPVVVVAAAAVVPTMNRNCRPHRGK